MRFDRIDDSDRPIDPLEEPLQSLAAEEANTSSPFREKQQIACELDCISVPLLVKDEDAASAGIFAFPLRDRRGERMLRRPRQDPAVFVEIEALLEIPLKKQKGGFVVVGVSGGRLARQGRVETAESLLETAQIFERDGSPGEGFGIIGP